MNQKETGGVGCKSKANADQQPFDLKHKAGKRMMFLMLGLAAVIIAFMVMIYPFVMVGAPAEADIRIPRDATDEVVRDTLVKYFGEDYTDKVFRIAYIRKHDFKQRHGLYHIYKGTNALNTMRHITSGGQSPVRLVINGFRSQQMLEQRISEKLDFPADSIHALLQDPAYLAKYGLTPENALALFFNDTYEMHWSNSPREVLHKIGRNYNIIWNEERRKAAAVLGLTPAEVCILASIVDEETNNLDEKGTIGRLYLNRLAIGMPLQADPTIRFALNDFTRQRLRSEDLKVESPYNTYTHRGLPPGPIRTPDARTIAAILESKPHKYLYMCAREDFSGTHKFAENYSEHLQNAARYQRALNERGIQR